MKPDTNSNGVSYYDIVIIGAGPSGLMLSTILARWGYRIKHVDNRPEPTATGRADGIQPRSLDLLRNMGLKSAIMSLQPARVYKVAFWDPSGTGDGITRTGTWASCPDFVGARYPFTTLVHQGCIERVFIADLNQSGVEIQRPWTIDGFTCDVQRDPEYPVQVELRHAIGTQRETVRAKYLFGGDGARSFVRKQLEIGVRYRDPVAHVWAVMDGPVKSNFPDIKMKCTIHSKHGSIMVIPRENNMVRLYVQIASSTDADFHPGKTATEAEVQAMAKKILQPYSIEWDSVEWFSIYPIGQGIADRYSLDCRVFLGGDACHTHSPKAGQGMNTAFLDAHNLAWKLHAVERGFADPSLLQTYESERRPVAETLLDFDNKYAELFSRRPSVENGAAPGAGAAAKEDDEFVQMFKASCDFTSGYGVSYQPNQLNWSPAHRVQSRIIHPANDKMRIGRAMPHADVTRVADANVVHLELEIPLNGSFRVFLFAGDPSTTRPALEDFANGLAKHNSFYAAYRRKDLASVSHHEMDNPHSWFFTICTVFASARDVIEIDRDVPALLARYRQHIYADDRPGAHAPSTTIGGAHAKLGIDRRSGGVVVVRPDGYVALTTALVRGPETVDVLNGYFDTFCSKKLGQTHLAQL